MTIATALLLTVLSAGTDQGPLQAADPALAPTAERQQSTTGIIIAADIEGRLAIYDRQQRLVVELDKPAGRQLQVSLEPGGYEARLGGAGTRRMRFQIGEGQQMLIALASFEDREPAPPPVAGAPYDYPAPHHHPQALDGRHRIEVRFGGWGDGWYDYDETSHYSGTAQAAFGVEYLNFLRNDIGLGVGLTTLARGNGGWDDWDESGTAQAICSIPIVVRWYPIRRVTRSRSVEPYVTAGIGPVFGVNTVYRHDDDPYHWDGDHIATAHVGTTIGGRVGGGVDFRLGSIFSIGVAGAWNWDAGFSEDLWRDSLPHGGEFTVVFGWTFGR
jgi:hypothetical protein